MQGQRLPYIVSLAKNPAQICTIHGFLAVIVPGWADPAPVPMLPMPELQSLWAQGRDRGIGSKPQLAEQPTHPFWVKGSRPLEGQ